MHSLFLPITGFLNKKRKAISDTKVFRLHTITTPALFMSFSVLYGIKEFVGEPIYCLGSGLSVDKQLFINSFCWISATYSVEEYFSPAYAKYLPYPGVGQLLNWNTVIFHRFYMWIPFYFLFLALLFYTPKYVWKHFEAGHMKMLMEKLDIPVIHEKATNHDRIDLLGEYIHNTLGFNSCYALTFFGCEALNFFVVIFGFYTSNLLINHKFATYGPDVVKYWRDSNNGQKLANPMTTVFPKLTKCSVNFYGKGGNIVPVDTICIMSVNNFNDKVFLFIWFYFVILGCISGLAILLRLLIIFSPRLRTLMLKKSFISIIKITQYSVADKLSTKLQVGDWFVIHQLGKNINKLAFVDFLDVLVRKLEPDKDISDMTV